MSEQNQQIESLRELAGYMYQFAGVHNAPEKWLDALSAAANGEPFSTEGLLPYAATNQASPQPTETEMPKPLLMTDEELVRLVYEFNLQDARQLIYESEKDGIDIDVPTYNFRNLANYLLRAAWNAAKGVK